MTELDLMQGDLLNLTSPYYPQQFPLFQDCTWNVSKPSDGVIKIEFKDLQAGLNYDELYIARQNATIVLDLDESIVSNDVLMYTGTQYPRVILVKESELRVVWDADYWTEGGRGFWMELSLESSNGKEFMSLK